MLSLTSQESPQTIAEKTTQTRMDIRLARRVGLHSMTHSPRIEPPFAHQKYVMRSLILKEEVYEPEALMSEEAMDSNESEDDAWLNDRVPARPEPSSPVPILKEQSAHHHTLSCWL